MSTIALTNATVFDATGAEPVEGATVVVDGEVIVEVGVGGKVPRKADQVIDCGGRTLMPGLMDAHVHIGAIDVNILEQHRNYQTSHAALKMGRVLTRTLLQGYTTVRDAGGCDAGFRQAVNQGDILGPRLLVSNAALSMTGGHADWRRPTERGKAVECCSQVGMSAVVADGPEEIRKAVRENIRTGADQIKVMASGGAMSPADELDTIQYSPEELRMAVETATAAGKYVLAHAYSSAAIRNCVKAGVRSIEHGNLMDEKTAELLAAEGTYLVPTLSTYELLHRQGAEHGVAPEPLEKIRMAHEQGLRSLEYAYRSGVRIASGSDLLGPMFEHKHRELSLKAEIMPAAEVLIATTRVNAELFGLADRLGTIETGKLADLIIVDGHPWENIAVFAAPTAVPVVIKAGDLVKYELT
ncbi:MULTISPECIES: metal-dependent hydrolase family protein [Micromonospora]|uniref:metal-dependent hydrolase family protein n=1 Tax=Micromonospora TaxID=1873 RepID=UPI0013C4E2B4|nr:amidohydrolase family protein [Micromonospora tulbaghiae]